MIQVDMPTDAEQKNTDSLRRRWQDGRLAAQPGMATIVLAVVLVLTIVAAQVMVSARTGHLPAILNAESLIDTVAQNGLNHYLPNQISVRYYLIEEKGKPTNFSVLIVEPKIQSDSSCVYQIHELNFHPEEYKLKQSWLTVDNQLQWFDYQYKFQDLQSGDTFSLYQKRKNNQWVSYLQVGMQRIFLQMPNFSTRNLTPLPLLDFFSSLTEEHDAEEGIYLALPTLTDEGLSQGILDITEVWVKSHGEIPDEVTAAAPDGHSVHVDWYPQTYSQNPQHDNPEITHQEIYYDRQHQLVWQKDFPSETITRVVAQNELIESFPIAAMIMRKWMNIQLDTNEHADDEEVL